MPRLTWSRSIQKEIDTAREAFAMYGRRRFIARHEGAVVKTFNPNHQVLDFELQPSAFDRVLKEDDPWES